MQTFIVKQHYHVGSNQTKLVAAAALKGTTRRRRSSSKINVERTQTNTHISIGPASCVFTSQHLSQYQSSVQVGEVLLDSRPWHEFLMPRSTSTLYASKDALAFASSRSSANQCDAHIHLHIQQPIQQLIGGIHMCQSAATDEDKSFPPCRRQPISMPNATTRRVVRP